MDSSIEFESSSSTKAVRFGVMYYTGLLKSNSELKKKAVNIKEMMTI
jgi:hypothetical protein